MKLSNLTYGFLALVVAVISSNSQERGRGDRERGSRDAQWAREAMERLRGSDRGNPLDSEAVKRRLDYAVREGLMTREQADKMMVDAKKRMEAAQRENNDRRGRGGNTEGRSRESQSNDRQADARKGYEIRRKRIEEGVKSGKIKREDAAKMYAELRERMEAANRGSGDEPRTNQRRGDDRKRVDMEAIRKRVEEGVRSGRIKREDAGRIIEGIRKRMEAANRDGSDKKEEGKEDPRLARYRAAERELSAAVKAGKLSKEDASKKLIGVRKQLWGGENARTNQKRGGDRGGDGTKRGGTEKRPDQRPQSKNSKSNSQPRGSQAKSSQSRGSSRGYLGVSVESSSKPRGVRVQQVYANTAAARAKLKKGDIILKINGAAVTSGSGLVSRLSKTKPGQKATLLVWSGGKAGTVQVQYGGSYSTRSSAQSSSSRSRDSQSSQKMDSSRRTPQRSSGTDWRKAIEERMKQAREAREKAERDSHRRDNDRGEAMRKAWEERMKKAREDRERAERNSRGRSNDRGDDMRKAIGEWMERAREMRERSERDSRGRGNDRGREMRERDGHRPEAQRGSERGRGPQWRGPQTHRGPQGRGPGTQRGSQGRGPQPGGSWRGGPGGSGRGGPRGR